MQFVSRHLGRWPVALACVALLAAGVLLPGLGRFGLWEPQERQAADRNAPRAEVAAKQQAESKGSPPAVAKDGCERMPPKDAVARTLTNRAMTWGRDHIGDSDAGRRLPLALLGVLTVLASAGIAMRLVGARAGVLVALVLLAMPLLVFQSRQLLSEIGIPAGAALTLYGLVALGARTRWAIVDSFVALVALAAGIAISFVAGGALLGLLVPIAAYAVAHGLGVGVFRTLGRAGKVGAVRLGRRFHWRWAIGRDAAYAPDGLDASDADQRPATGDQLKALLATLAVIGLVGVLAYQVFSLVEPQPGLTPPQRAVLGKAVVASGCWSSALGALWRPEDDLRYSFDSTFEQIGYGTFPWGIVGPIAMFALLGSIDRRRRILGGLTLAWAAGAWIAAEVFQRKVGFTLYAGFPAIAIATGVWLDDIVATQTRTTKTSEAPRDTYPAGAMLVGLFVALAVINLGKDLQSFPERITSLLIGGDAIQYPKMARLALLPTKLWILVLGAVVALSFATALIVWRDHPVRAVMRKAARIGLAIALAMTVIIAAFWSHGWQPDLASHLSSKSMFDAYRDLRRSSDQLVIMGDMGEAAASYAPDAKPELVSSRDQIVAAIGRPERVFAIAPQTELCQLHREIGGKPYFVIDDRNTRSLLLSNRIDGATDKNPLRTSILHTEPKNIPSRPKAPIVFDDKIELLGWSIPRAVDRGDKFTVTVFYKVLKPVGANWRVLFHFDGGPRFNGDHEPIKGRCQTATWQAGDYIVDTHTVTAGAVAFTPGPYEVWTGFFSGSAPNWRNMPVSKAPADMRDTVDRVKLTTITLQ